MKKSILLILIILLAFSVWSVLAFGKAKKEEPNNQVTSLQKSQAEVNEFPDVVLPSNMVPSMAIPGTDEEFQKKVMEAKGWTPEQLEELKSVVGEPVTDDKIARLSMYCDVRNQPPGGARYCPAGCDYLMYWEQVRMASLLDLDHNYASYADACNPPYYPFDVDEIWAHLYTDVECTLEVFGQIYRSQIINDYHCRFLAGPVNYTDTIKVYHEGGFIWIGLALKDSLVCVNEPFYAVFAIRNTDDWGPGGPYEGFALSWIYAAEAKDNCQAYWNSSWLGTQYWYPAKSNGIASGAFRIEVSGHTQPTNSCPYPPVNEWYFKDPFADAPCGVPDFDQYQMPHTAYCGPTAGANSVWWFAARGDFPPSWGGFTPADPPLLINEIAAAAGTTTNGTECDELQTAILEVIKNHGGWWFYEETYYGFDSSFTEVSDMFWVIQRELRDCEDVVLLLGFWQTPDEGASWYRFGGHFVTVAGVDIYPNPEGPQYHLAFSDPAQDAAELGLPGVVCHDSLAPYPHVGSPLVHNDVANASHDFYEVAWPSVSPGGNVWIPYYEVYEGFQAFQGQNFRSVHTPFLGTYNDQLPVHVEIEQAIVVSPGPLYFFCPVQSSHIQFIMSNFGKEGDGSGYDFYNFVDGSGNHLYDGTLLMGRSGDDMAANFGTDSYGYDPVAPCEVVDTVLYANEDGDTLYAQIGTALFRHTYIPDILISHLVMGFYWTKNPLDYIETFILQEFDITNTGTEVIDAVAHGMFFDWDVDIDLSPSRNTGGGDSLYNTAWQTGDSNCIMVTLVPETEGLLCPHASIAEQNNYFYPFAPGPYDSMYALMTEPYWVYPLSSPPDYDYGMILTTPELTLVPEVTQYYTWFKWQFHGDAAAAGDSTKMSLDARRQLYRLLQWKGFYRGDLNYDFKLDVSDVIYFINYLFKNGPRPDPIPDHGDVNCDGKPDVSDVIYMINYLFKNGPAPIDKNRWKEWIVPRPGLWGDPIWRELPKEII